MSNSSSLVRVKEAIVVKPSGPTPTRILPLSSLDSQLFLRFTIEYLLIFRPRGGVDSNAVAARLKSALARILVPYYPLAGRVRAKPDGSGLEVVCRAQGAVFVEAVSDHFTTKEFDKAPRCVSQWRKLLSLHVADVLKEAPPLVIQLTWLKDGAAALAVGVNHCVTDGIGSSDFLNSFAELAQTHVRAATADVKPKPLWDRHLLDPVMSTRAYSLSHLEFNRVPDLCAFTTRFADEKLLTPTSIIFDKTSLTELKRVATPTNTFTSFEVLSAHVWRSWARALNLPENQILKLLFSVNIRNRVKPSIPNGYYGNAFILGCAQATVKELAEQSLRHVAMLVKSAKERINAEYVKSVVDSVSRARACPDSVGVLIMSQWSRLGLERVDFGMGKPVHVFPVLSDRYCLLLPVCDKNDAVKVMVAVPSYGVDTYERLLKNPCWPVR